jgi:hypothetical protein
VVVEAVAAAADGEADLRVLALVDIIMPGIAKHIEYVILNDETTQR